MSTVAIDLFGTGHVCNPELIKTARQQLRKVAFIPGGDPSAAAAGGGGGGAPPMDPAAMGGGGGGAPPPSGGADGGGGGGSVDQVMMELQQLKQQMMMMQQGGGGGAGGAGGAGALKPKIDVNVEMMQVKNMLAKLLDHAGIQMPAQDMVATPEKLMAMAQGQPTTVQSGGAGAQSGAPGGGAIGGIDPMQGMQPAGVPGQGQGKAASAQSQGVAFDTAGLGAVRNRAAAIARIRRANAA